MKNPSQEIFARTRKINQQRKNNIPGEAKYGGGRHLDRTGGGWMASGVWTCRCAKGRPAKRSNTSSAPEGTLNARTPTILEPKLCARNPVFPNKHLNETGKFPALGCGGPWVLYTQNIKEFVQNPDAARIHHAFLTRNMRVQRRKLTRNMRVARFLCPQKPCFGTVFRVLKNRVFRDLFSYTFLVSGHKIQIELP